MVSESNSGRRSLGDKLISAFWPSLPDDDARLSEAGISIQVLRAGCSIAFVFLFLYLGYDLLSGRGGGFSSEVFHWITILVTLGFFAASFTARLSHALEALEPAVLDRIDFHLHYDQRANLRRRFKVHRNPALPGRDRRLHQLGMALAGADGSFLHRAVWASGALRPACRRLDLSMVRAVRGSRGGPMHFVFHRRLSSTDRRAGRSTEAGGRVSGIANRHHGA